MMAPHRGSAGAYTAAVVLLAALLFAGAAALSPNEARRQHLMNLDPRMPVKPSHVHQYQQQQHLQQQVEQIVSHNTNTHKRSRKPLRRSLSRSGAASERSLARSLLGEEGHQQPGYTRTKAVVRNLPPDSCYHYEQQVVRLLLDFNCSNPVVQEQSEDDLAAKVCAAALKRLQSTASKADSSSDYSYEESTTTECHMARSCSGAAPSGDSSSTSLQLTVSIFLPYCTCAVVQQLLADQASAQPQLLLASEPALAAAVLSATHVPSVDSRLASIQAAIQSGSNAILQAVVISAEEAADLGLYGGAEEGASEDGPGWLWDPSRGNYSRDASTGIYSIWIAGLCTFAVGMVVVALLVLHRGVLRLARWRAEQQLIRRVRADALADAEEGADSSDSDSEMGSS